MMNQLSSGTKKWIALAAVAALAGLPAIGQARAHYTGTVPASVMMAAATTPARTPATRHKLTSTSRRTRLTAVSHKKSVKLVKHKKVAKKKHHKKSKKA